MIILKIMGGYGNQMFQYALARELLYRGKEVKADFSYYMDTPLDDTKRNSARETLFADLPVAEDEIVQAILQKNEKLRWKLANRIGLLSNYAPVYVQRNGYQYSDKIFSKQNVYAIGWWQNEQYFTNVEDLVRTEYLNGIDKLSRQNENLLEKIQSHTNSVSIHVRGGDYNNIFNSAAFGGVCGKEYYKNAADFLRDRFEDCFFYVFTNDMQYTKEILPDLKSYEIVMNSEADGLQDIFLMSRCKYHIIANSSFSWWGAWLDSNNNKVVIAPKRWSRKNAKSPNCKGWITM